MSLRSHIRKYEQLVWSLYDIKLSHLNSQFFRYDFPEVCIIWHQSNHYVSQPQSCNAGGESNIAIFTKGQQGVSTRLALQALGLRSVVECQDLKCKVSFGIRAITICPSHNHVTRVVNSILQYSPGASRELAHGQPAQTLGLGSVVECQDPKYKV